MEHYTWSREEGGRGRGEGRREDGGERFDETRRIFLVKAISGSVAYMEG